MNPIPTSRQADAAAGPKRRERVWHTPLAVFLLSLLVLGLLCASVWRSIEVQDRTRFDSEVSRTANGIRERVDTVVALLDGTAGLFAASEDVRRPEFAAFVRRLQLSERYPGILGIGFSRRILPQALEAVQLQFRREWGSGFRVWPAGPREEYESVVFLEPVNSRNLAALGFDMSSEPTRRVAMEAARDTGLARASAKVTLVQEIDPQKQAGFLIYLAVYAGRGVPGEVAQRRAQLAGYVYSPLRVDDLLQGARAGGQLDYELYDGDRPDPTRLMRTTLRSPQARSSPGPRFTATRRIDVAGRPWRIDFRSSPAFDTLSQRQLRPVLVLVALATSGLLAFIAWSQGRARQAAEAAARDNARLYEDLQENDRRKDQFLATLAHELRNPLAPIRTSLEIVRRAPGTPAARRALDVAERQTRHMVRLVEDLLDVSRISRGAIVLRRDPVRLASVIDAAVETSLPLVEARGHRLDVAPVDQRLLVRGDATRLAQVFANLLNNAATYTEPGGRITVTALAGEANVEVIVRDTGIGLPEAMLERIFDLFTQAERPGSAGGGLGIGLTLVRSLVEMHGGSVHAESEGHGRGSALVVRLPRLVTAASPEAQPTPELEPVPVPVPVPVPGPETEPVAQPAAQPLPAGPLDILVVDDNVDAAESLTEMLAQDGHRVRSLHDGPSALASAAQRLPDVALLDIGLPGMSGYELARHLRQLPGGRQVRLVAVTGWGQPQDRRRAAEAGFDLHLVKPVDYGTLAAQLGRGTRQSQPG